MSTTPHVNALARTARSLGYTTKTYTKGGDFSKIVKIVDPKNQRFWFVAPRETGFYPDTLRWFKTVANSKILSEQLLRELGYQTIRSTFFTDPTETKTATKTRIKKLTKFPYLIKPEEGNKGRGIQIVTSSSELTAYAAELYDDGRQFMVQPLVFGTEYRVLVINKKVRVAHTKEFPTVTADGIRTVADLLRTASYTVDDRFVDSFLQSNQLTRTSVPDAGVQIPIHITRKGSTTYYSNFNPKQPAVPKHIAAWGARLAKDLGVGTLGIDVFIPNNPKQMDTATIIEINASPGFVYLGQRYKDAETVRHICEEVLRSYFT